MDRKQQDSIMLEGGPSMFVPDDDDIDDDDGTDDEQHQLEMEEELKEGGFLGLIKEVNTDNEEDDDMATSEETFNRGINEKNISGKYATSTPYAATTFQRSQTLQQQTLDSPFSSSHNRGKGDYLLSAQKYPRARDAFRERLEDLPEVETTGMREGMEPPPKRSLLNEPSYERVRDLEKATSRFSGSPGLGRSNLDSLLSHESLHPKPERESYDLLCDAKDREIQQLRRDMDKNCAELEKELSQFQNHVEELSKEKLSLAEERARTYAEVEALRKETGQLRNALKEVRADLDAAKNEKQDLLRKIHMQDGKLQQMEHTLNQSTPWEVIDQLKSNHETTMLQIKEVHQSELRKFQDQAIEDTRRYKEQFERSKKDMEAMYEKLQATEADRNRLQAQIDAPQKEAAKATASTPSTDLLRLQLKAKMDDLERYAKRTSELEEKLSMMQRESSEETSRLREDLSKAVQENIAHINEQTETVKNNVQMREDIAKLTKELDELKKERLERSNETLKLQSSARSAQAEIASLKVEVEQGRKEREDFERARSELQALNTQLQQELAARNVPVNNRVSLDLIRQQVKRKEGELAEANRRFREMEDNRHSQFQRIADENTQLKEDKARLQNDVSLMRKVLRKLKKHIANNPSPSGDSGFSAEIKTTDVNSSKGTVAGDETMKSEREISRERMAQRAEDRRELERRYQQQLEIDRRKIIAQVDGLYKRKLQQVVVELKIAPTSGNHQPTLSSK
ncbi:hypothetical protein RvY_04730 [Ramazzottius varieornatus]|uniref:Uncharacterized protein n=1 Tax=Ramazzottius varieornatus TaxID=947166 RepID=A0A1D1UTA1_RAMVA|nr:hypothetical protein RvY_04730 [Ramazzottius varieornatus]